MMYYWKQQHFALAICILIVKTYNPVQGQACNPTCQNGGACVSGNCNCTSGWTGPACTTAICNNPACDSDKVCIAPEVCKKVEKPSVFAGFYSPVNCGRGFRLNAGDRFQVLTSVTLEACMRACLKAGDFKCRSLSYNPASPSQCWLNVGHTNQLWEGLEAAPGWFYYHIETYGEIPPCKANTFRDCTVVQRLGFGPGNYSFQTDIGERSFNTECIYFQGYASNFGTVANTVNDLMIVMHRRSKYYDINYANKTWQDYKWGFASKTNTTKWVGLEWMYRLMAGDFILVVYNSATYCVELATLNATTTYLVVKQETATTSKNCAVFTHRQGNLMVVTRSTCLCKDPATSYVVTCGCNTLQSRKFAFPFTTDNYVSERYQPPWSYGTSRWSVPSLSTGYVLASEITTPSSGTAFFPRSTRWNYVQFFENPAGVFNQYAWQKVTLDTEANGYRIFKPTYGANSMTAIDGPSPGPGVIGADGYYVKFVTPDRGGTNAGGGFWMPSTFACAGAGCHVCLTCFAGPWSYGHCNWKTGYDGMSLIMLYARPEGQA